MVGALGELPAVVVSARCDTEVSHSVHLSANLEKVWLMHLGKKLREIEA